MHTGKPTKITPSSLGVMSWLVKNIEPSPSPHIPHGGFDRLNKILQSLSRNERETARQTLHGYEELYGLDSIANGYALLIHVQKHRGPKSKKPHEIEKELLGLAAAVRDLQTKLKCLSKDCLELIKQREKDLENPCINSWLPVHPEPQFFHGDPVNEEDYALGSPVRQLELGDLAKDLDLVARDIVAKKQAPNGIRTGLKGRVGAVGWMIYEIGRIVTFRKRPLGHALPIARKIHEWVTGETPGEEWGKRPFERLKPQLKAWDWSWISDEERIAPPPHDPKAGARRMEQIKERLKASLRAQPEVVAK